METAWIADYLGEQETTAQTKEFLSEAVNISSTSSWPHNTVKMLNAIELWLQVGNFVLCILLSLKRTFQWNSLTVPELKDTNSKDWQGCVTSWALGRQPFLAFSISRTTGILWLWPLLYYFQSQPHTQISVPHVDFCYYSSFSDSPLPYPPPHWSLMRIPTLIKSDMAF